MADFVTNYDPNHQIHPAWTILTQIMQMEQAAYVPFCKKHAWLWQKRNVMLFICNYKHNLSCDHSVTPLFGIYDTLECDIVVL